MKTSACRTPLPCQTTSFHPLSRLLLCGIAALTGMAAAPSAKAQAANDHFADAKLISGVSGSVPGSTVGATKETGEPNHGHNIGGNSIWYQWQAPVSGMVEFELLDSDYDTTMGAYRGPSVNALTPVAANDETFEFLNVISRYAFFISQSRIRFPIESGQTYWIAVDGYNDTMFGLASGNVVLRWQVGPRPANDNFSQAQVLDGHTGHVLAQSAGATKEAGEPNHAGNTGGASIWFSWTPLFSGLAQIQTFVSLNPAGGAMDTLLGVYTGSSVDALAAVTSSDNVELDIRSQVTFAASAGTTYRIAVDGKNLTTNIVHGEVLLVWTVGVPASNDTFTMATVLESSCGMVRGNNFAATKEIDEPNHAGNGGGASVWFTWTAPADGPAVFSTGGSPEFDTMLTVYTGGSVGALSGIVSNDDAGLSFRGFRAIYSRVEFTASAGTTYHIALDGWEDPDAPGLTPEKGVYLLSWGLGAPPNDEFFGAALITGASGTIQTCNYSATEDIGEPDHAGNPGGRSIWYQWTVPASGVATIDLTGSTFDTLLAVYTGNAVDALTLVATNENIDVDTFESRVCFQAEVGTTYMIAVDGLSVPAGGIFLTGWVTMNYSVAPAPILQITQDGANLKIDWSGPYRLESTTALDPQGGTVWVPFAKASPASVPNTGGQMFFRAVCP